MPTDTNAAAQERFAEGVNAGDFDVFDEGVAPTGRKITARGVQIGRFENGRLVERRGSSDQPAILRRPGAEPKQGGGVAGGPDGQDQGGVRGPVVTTERSPF